MHYFQILTTNTFEIPEIVSNERKEDPLKTIDTILNDSTFNISNITTNKSEDEEIEVIDDDNVETLETINIKPDIKDVIKKVEELVNDINNLGFDVELEKYDFDGLYQFVIKVERD